MGALLHAIRDRTPLPFATPAAPAPAAPAADRPPHWPFGTLTPMQMRTRAAQEKALQKQALSNLPEALL